MSLPVKNKTSNYPEAPQLVLFVRKRSTYRVIIPLQGDSCSAIIPFDQLHGRFFCRKNAMGLCVLFQLEVTVSFKPPKSTHGRQGFNHICFA
jgi:hypothetical protein